MSHSRFILLFLPLSFLRSAFAPTQTVVCAYANGRLRVRKQSKGRTYPSLSWHLSLHPLPGTFVLQRMHHRIYSPVILLFLLFIWYIQINCISLQHRQFLLRQAPPSGSSESIRGQRAVLYMRKTFSDVCRCETRTSQTRPSQQADDNEASRRAYLYPYYI